MDEETKKAQCMDFWPTNKELSLETLELLAHGMVDKLTLHNEYWRQYLSIKRNSDRITLWFNDTGDCDQFWQELTDLCICARLCGVLTAVSGEVEFPAGDGRQYTITAGPGYLLEQHVLMRVASWGTREEQVKMPEADDKVSLGVVQKVWEDCKECPNLRVACVSETTCTACMLSPQDDNHPMPGCLAIRQCKLDNRRCDHNCYAHNEDQSAKTLVVGEKA